MWCRSPASTTSTSPTPSSRPIPRPWTMPRRGSTRSWDESRDAWPDGIRRISPHAAGGLTGTALVDLDDVGGEDPLEALAAESFPERPLLVLGPAHGSSLVEEDPVDAVEAAVVPVLGCRLLVLGDGDGGPDIGSGLRVEHVDALPL